MRQELPRFWTETTLCWSRLRLLHLEVGHFIDCSSIFIARSSHILYSTVPEAQHTGPSTNACNPHLHDLGRNHR